MRAGLLMGHPAPVRHRRFSDAPAAAHAHAPPVPLDATKQVAIGSSARCRHGEPPTFQVVLVHSFSRFLHNRFLFQFHVRKPEDEHAVCKVPAIISWAEFQAVQEASAKRPGSPMAPCSATRTEPCAATCCAPSPGEITSPTKRRDDGLEDRAVRKPDGERRRRNGASRRSRFCIEVARRYGCCGDLSVVAGHTALHVGQPRGRPL